MRILWFWRLLVLTCLATSFGTFSATAADFDVSLGTGYLSGDSTYQIGGLVIDNSGLYEIHFPLSELKFPLDSVMLKGEVGISFADKWRFSGNIQTNVTQDTGKMEDSDWIFSPYSLDVFSKSDAEMTALLLDAKLQYRFYQGFYGETAINNGSRTSNLLFSYFVGLGYRHQRFEFDVSNTDQWYPSDPSHPHDYFPGLSLTYEVEYQIPYLELSMDMIASDQFNLILNLGFAPWVNVTDEDHHLLRGLVGISDHDWNGNAEFISVEGRYHFNAHWYLALEAAAMKISSKGRTNSYDHGDWDHSITQKIESRQLSSFLRLGYQF